MALKLIISDKVAFDVRFVLNAEGKDHEFGMRMEALRIPHDMLVLEARSPAVAGKPMSVWLRERVQMRMVSWFEDRSPLKDADTDAFIAPGDTALDALGELVSNVPGLIYAGYVNAITAKGKSGN